MTPHEPPHPRVSFAVPVRNGARTLPRLLASLRSQDLPDIEIVVSDNCSTDETSDILRSLARRDARIRHIRNETNIGQVANFNRVFELCRAPYVRWIGADDWLEPSYARRCVEALEQAPEAVGVTTYQDHVEDDGTRHYAEYVGERLDSPRAEDRYRRMLWFFHEDYRYADPIYAMFRRHALLRTRRFLMVPAMDHVLASELALLGPFVHVPECLAHRGRETLDEDERLRRYVANPARSRELDPFWRAGVTYRAMREAVVRAELTPRARAQCMAALVRYVALVCGRNAWWRTRTRLGIARRHARAMVGSLGERGAPPKSTAGPKPRGIPSPAPKRRRRDAA
jgi:glycosyltransferase involved in cell wall biosynthesis